MARSALSRRSLLGGAGGVAIAGAVAGCRLDPPSPTPEPAHPGLDEQIVTAARAELAGLIAGLVAGGARPGLVACHRDQLAALDGRARHHRRTRPIRQDDVAGREREVMRKLGHWAETCDDGDLARVLAAIRAGIGMQPELVAS